MRFGAALAAEVRKTRTLRPLVWTVLISSLLMVAFASADSRNSREHILNPSEMVAPGLTALDAGIYSFFNFTFLPIALAALMASSEYAGGQLTTSVLALPRRGVLLAAKFVIVIIVTAGLGLLQAVIIVALYQGRLGDISVFATGEVSTYFLLLGWGIYHWVALGILSMSAALIVKHQAGVIAAMVTLEFGSTPLLMLSNVFQYLPGNAGSLMLHSVSDATWVITITPDLMGAQAAATVTALWSLAAIVAVAIVFVRRDVGPGPGPGLLDGIF